MNRKSFRLGWAVAVLALATMACTCGLAQGLGQAQQGLQTARALSTEAVALATEVEESGLVETAQALATEVETGGLEATAAALATEASGGGGITFGSAPEDVPVIPDNSTFFGSEDVVSYMSSVSFADAVDFYKKEMPNNGWSEAPGSVETTGAAVLYFEKEGRKATVTISDAGGQTSVQVLIEK